MSLLTIGSLERSIGSMVRRVACLPCSLGLLLSPKLLLKLKAKFTHAAFCPPLPHQHLKKTCSGSQLWHPCAVPLFNVEIDTLSSAHTQKRIKFAVCGRHSAISGILRQSVLHFR